MTRTTTPSGFPVGKVLISTAALVPAVGAFVADWNETHVFNPTWPPHAKFHNAQTITLAVVAAGLSGWEAWRPGPMTPSRLRWSTICGGLFWVTQLPAPLFPGSATVDPDSPYTPTSKFGIPINQITAIGALVLPLLGAGYALESRRMRRTATR